MLYPDTVGLCEAVPVGSGVGVRSEGVRGTEGDMLLLLHQQQSNEQRYIKETKHMPRSVNHTLYSVYILYTTHILQPRMIKWFEIQICFSLTLNHHTLNAWQ